MGRPRTEQAENYRRGILVYIRDFKKANGFAPRPSEMAEEFGIARSSVAWHLKILRDEGLIDVQPGDARTLTLTAAGGTALRRIRRQAAASVPPVNTRLARRAYRPGH